jgi:hypothetical protein
MSPEVLRKRPDQGAGQVYQSLLDRAIGIVRILAVDIKATFISESLLSKLRFSC